MDGPSGYFWPATRIELVLEPIRSACGSLPVEEGYTMAQLGRACGIAVGAAVVTVLN